MRALSEFYQAQNTSNKLIMRNCKIICSTIYNCPSLCSMGKSPTECNRLLFQARIRFGSSISLHCSFCTLSDKSYARFSFIQLFNGLHGKISILTHEIAENSHQYLVERPAITTAGMNRSDLLVWCWHPEFWHFQSKNGPGKSISTWNIRLVGKFWDTFYDFFENYFFVK